MPVPASINDLSTTVASNSPSGSETPTDGDNYLRTFASFIALLRDLTNGTTAPTLKTPTVTGTPVFQGSAATWSGNPTHSGNHTFSGTVAAANLASGTYTPTITNTTNITSTSALACQYMRVGSAVTVSGHVTINPATAGAYTEIGISLPIASDLSDSSLAGMAAQAQGSGIGTAGFVGSDAANDRAKLGFTCSADDASRNWTFTFTYLVA
jgi:hypothetical protein